MIMKLYDNDIKESHQKSSPPLTISTITRWKLDHLEKSRASANYSDLGIALRRMICPTGFNSDFYNSPHKNPVVVLPYSIDWVFIINMNP